MNNKRVVFSLVAAMVVICVGAIFYCALPKGAGREATVAEKNAIQEAAYEGHPASAAEAVTRNPDDVNAHLALAHRYIGQRNYPAAASQLAEVTRIQPGNRSAIYLRGLTLQYAGNKQQAVSVWKDLTKQDDSWGKAARRKILQSGS